MLSSYSIPVLADSNPAVEPRSIRVVMDENYPPYIMRKADGTLDGYLVDIWALWQKKTGVVVDIIAQDWLTAQKTMANGDADVIDTIFRTPQRELKLDFSQPYATLPVAIYASKDQTGIVDMSGLQGFQVGVKSGDACIDKLNAEGITNLQTYPSYAQLVQAAIAKKIHVFCMDELPANYLIFRAEASQLFRKAFIVNTGEFHRAVHKDDSELLTLIEHGFSAITPAEMKALNDKWMGQKLSHPLDKTLVYGLLIMIAGSAFLFAITIWLRRKVKYRTAELVAITNQLETTIDAIPDLLFELDFNGRYLACHSPRTDLLVVPAEQLLGRTVMEILPAEASAICMAALVEAKEKGHSQGMEFELTLADGIHWFELSVAPKQMEAQAIPSFIVLSHDITNRKLAELKVERLTKLYAALSHCNQAIVRSAHEAELYPIICRNAVIFGGMKMAWIGLLDETSQMVIPVASFGEGIDYLDGIDISVDLNKPSGQGPTGTAIRDGRPVWCQNFQHESITAAWHERAVSFGWQASASLPLYRRGVVVGAFSLYADVINAFDEPAQNLLLEMAMDISYALDNFSKEADRKRNEAQQHKLATVVEQTPSAIIITDLDGNIEYTNQAFSDVSGYSRDEVIGRSTHFLQSDKTSLSLYKEIWAQITDGKVWQGEMLNQRKDGSEYTDLTLITPLFDEQGNITNYLSIKENLTEKKQAEARIQYLAYFDQLTGLPNRIQLNDRFNYSISLAQRNKQSLSVMFFDVDHFKNINDTLGHNIGDQLLIELAQRFKTVLREEDTLSRMGGDEFILLLPDTEENGATEVARKLLAVVTEPYVIDGHELVSTISIGIALYPHDGQDVETLSKNADTAMYSVKKSTRNNFCFFTEEMQIYSTRILQLTNALRHALIRNELQLYYQPQIAIQDGRLIGAEALLRWHHPELGMISPAEFIPVAESSGLIIEIGEWVLRTAVMQLKSWLDSGLPEMMMAVNISAVQFRHPNLPKLVTQILDEAQLIPEYLELELTESVAMDDPKMAIEIMDDLHSRGVRMSIDDFGTGYSSLSYLKKFKVYKLKIDQSFVRDINTDTDDKAIVATIISMASSLGMQTIAEGVETPEQLAFLRLQGCDEVQGYYFSKPLPKDKFEEFVRHKLP